MPATRRAGYASAAGVAGCLLLALPGCNVIAPGVMPPALDLPPQMDREVREELRTGEPLDFSAVLTELMLDLDDVPLEEADAVFRSAQEVATAAESLPSMTLELDDSRRFALEHNLSLQVDEYDPAIAEEGYRAELGKFEAVLGATLSQTDTRDALGAQQLQRSLEPSVRVPLTTGGTVNMSLPYSRSDNEGVDPFTGQRIGRSHSPQLVLSLSQPLLRNAGIDVNTASIRSAGLRVRQADSRTKLSAIRVLANTETAYWQYYAAYEELRIQVRQYNLALEQLRIAQRLVAEGVRTEVEVTRARSGVATRLGSVIQAETARRRSERALKSAMNLPDLPVTSERIILPATEPRPLRLIFDRDSVVALARENRMELFENEVQQLIDDITVSVNRNATLPDLRFEFRYSFSGTQPRLNRAIDDLFRSELNSYTASLTAEIPLAGNQAAKARLRESLLQKSRTVVNRRLLEQTISQETLDAVDAVEQNWQRVLATRTAADLAQDTYDAERLQFQLGETTSRELLQALSDLAEAQSALVRAIADYQTSVVDLAFATGTVLGSGGVVWTPADAPLRSAEGFSQ